jgi:hypothetical protein
MHRQLVLERSFLTVLVGYRGELGESCRPRDLYPMLRVFPGIAPTDSPNQSIRYIAEIDEHLVQSYPRRPVVSEYGDPASPITR